MSRWLRRRVTDDLSAAVIGAAVAAAAYTVWPDQPVTPALRPPAQTLPDPSAVPEAPRGEAGIGEDTPGFNCLTMGDQSCGPTFEAVPHELYGHLFPTRDPADPGVTCLWELAEQHTIIVCDNGTVVTS
jgi:hypothetical protein